jgi:hypothetical protein
MTDHNFVSLVNIEKLDRTGGFFFSIKRNRTVDHCGPHLDFRTAEADKRLLISCHVEIAGKDSVRRRTGELYICTLNHFGSVLAKAQHQFVKRFACFGGHFNPREALVRTFFPNFDFADLEIRAVSQNLIQNFRQNERINNMPA